MNIEILSTLWPSMNHYQYFAQHPLIKGIRLNTAMADDSKMKIEMEQAVRERNGTPLWFDVKGRQLRIVNVFMNKGNLELEINHNISVPTPTEVIFKAGADICLLVEVKDGKRLIFDGCPQYLLGPGESLNIRHPKFKVIDDSFTDQQKRFLSIALEAGIKRFMLSYATEAKEIDELKRLVGNDKEIVAKIESPAGLDLVESYKLPDKVHYMAARGDLFVEVPKPHQILSACKLIVQRDPQAILGSRILLSLSPHKDQSGKEVLDSVPSCSDINEIAWLLSIGYKRFMFCDGLCLSKEALDSAVCCLNAIAQDYI